jgi:hypothetical protein
MAAGLALASWTALVIPVALVRVPAMAGRVLVSEIGRREAPEPVLEQVREWELAGNGRWY